MKLILWVSIYAILVLTVVQASHHSQHQRSHVPVSRDSLDYLAVTTRHRKNKGTVGRSGKQRTSQRLRTETASDQSNELLLQGNSGSDWNPLSSETGPKQKVWLNLTEANKQIEKVILKRYKNEKAALKTSKRPDKKKKIQKDCHSVSMLQCGCESLKAFEKTLQENSYVKSSVKCEIRQKFFDCLGNASKVQCKRKDLKLLRPKSEYEKNKKEIVRVLWTTRECLLGQLDQRREAEMSSSELMINSTFCKKVAHSKGGKKKSNKPNRTNGRKLG